MNNLQKNWLEWSVFAVGLVLVLGTIGYLIYDAVTLGTTPPSLEVKLGKPQQRQTQFLVPVSVTNHGDETAEGVLVEVALESGGKETERAEFEIAFLPRQSTREGWVTFDKDPRAARLKARVLGYEKP